MGYLESIFAQESILRGSFDKYALSNKGKKGTAGVDDDILTEIESWRDELAKNIAIRNTGLSVEELNSIVQRTIDRLLFLRICEDRGIEDTRRSTNCSKASTPTPGSAISSGTRTRNTTPGSSISSRSRIRTNCRIRSRSR